VLYFDTSVVQYYSFNTKYWQPLKFKNVIHANSQMKCIKIFTLFSQHRLISLKFLKRSSTSQLRAFLQKSIA